MRVADILARKGDQVWTISHTQPVSDAVQIMHRQRIGAIVVANLLSGAPMGLISQSEILAALHELGPSALSHCATGIMRRPAPSCLDSTEVGEALSRMTLDRVRHLLVLNGDGGLLGLVSLGDLVAARISSAELEAGVLRDMARSRLLASSH